MSPAPLKALLIDAGQSGVFYVPQDDLPALAEAAAGLGFHYAALNLGGCGDKAALLERIAPLFAFPGDFGRNWDALADCLGDLAWLAADGVVLGITDPQSLQEHAPDDYATLIAVLEGASVEWRDRDRPFWTFIALPDEAFERLHA